MSGEQQKNEKKKGAGADLFKVTLIGNIGVPPEWKHKEGQAPFCVFTMGVGDSLRKGDETETLWFRITLWGKLAEIAMQYGLKSQQVYVEGRGVLSEWTNRDGQLRCTPEIAGTDFRMLGNPLDALARESARLEEEAIRSEYADRK